MTVIEERASLAKARFVSLSSRSARGLLLLLFLLVRLLVYLSVGPFDFLDLDTGRYIVVSITHWTEL